MFIHSRKPAARPVSLYVLRLARVVAAVLVRVSVLCAPTVAIAQEAPGGVASGITVWYDAGTGIPQNSTNLTASWSQRAGSAGETPLTILGSTGSIDSQVGVFNFNPAIRFNNPGGPGSGRHYGGPETRDQNWITPSTTGSAFAVASASEQSAILARGAGSTCGADLGRCNVGFRADTTGTNFGGNPSVTAYANAVNPGNLGPTVNVYGLWASSGANLHRNTRNGWTRTGPGVTKQAAADYQFTIGSFPGFSKDGQVAEVFYYDRKLSEQEAQRVTSYLGIKYGVTLDGDATRNNATNYDYLSAAGTVVWAGNGTTSVNAYHRNVFGLGRDSALDQRIATNMNDSGPAATYPLDILTVATGTLSAPSQFVYTHQSTGAQLAQGQYLMVGNNGGLTTAATGTSVSGVATPLDNGTWSRLNRLWRVQNTGAVGAVSLLFNVPAAGVTALGGDLNDVVLLVDNDGNYTNGGTRVVRAGRSVSGTQISFNVTLANGEIFTLANSTETLTLIKTTVQAAGTFAFALTGTVQTTGTVTMAASATTTVDGNTGVAGTQPFAIVSAGTALSITEGTLPATANLSSITCSNATTGVTFSPVYDLPNRTVSIPGASVNAGANITCTFTNVQAPAVINVEKALPTGRLVASNQFTLSMTGTGAPAAITTTGTGSTATGTLTHATATPGTAYTITETAAGNTVLANYTSTWACTNTRVGGQTPSGTGTSFSLTPAAGDNLTCTFANTVPVQPSFGTCDARMFFEATPVLTTNLYEMEYATSPFTYNLLGSSSTVRRNGIGYSVVDNYIYGIRSTGTLSDNELVRVGSDGSGVSLGPVAGLPLSSYNNGTISPANDMYVIPGTSTTMYRIDIDTLTATPITLSTTVSTTDMAWYNGLLYAVNLANPVPRDLITIDPTTGQVTTIGTVAPVTNALAMWAFANGIYAYQSGAGLIYSIDPATGRTMVVSPAPVTSNGDGTNCSTANIQFDADLSVSKTNTPASGPNDLADDAYVPGETRTYTIVVSNAGAFGSQGTTVSDPVPAGIDAASISWTCGTATGGAVCGAASGVGALLDTRLDLPPSSSVIYRVTLTVPAAFAGDLSNTVTVTPPSTINDTNAANNTATDGDSSAPRLTLRKISIGGVDSFGFTGTNGVVTQTLTTTTAGSPVSGATQVLTAAGIATTITESTLPPTYQLTDITCTGLGAGGTATPDLANRTVALDVAATATGANIECTFTNTLQQTDIQVVKSASPDPVLSGQVVTYSLVVTNNGPLAASNILLSDVAGVGQDCTTPSTTATCAATGGATCPSPTIPVSSLLGSGVTIPTLPVGGQVNVTLQCTVTATGNP